MTGPWVAGSGQPPTYLIAPRAPRSFCSRSFSAVAGDKMPQAFPPVPIHVRAGWCSDPHSCFPVSGTVQVMVSEPLLALKGPSQVMVGSRRALRDPEVWGFPPCTSEQTAGQQKLEALLRSPGGTPTWESGEESVSGVTIGAPRWVPGSGTDEHSHPALLPRTHLFTGTPIHTGL